MHKEALRRVCKPLPARKFSTSHNVHASAHASPMACMDPSLKMGPVNPAAHTFYFFFSPPKRAQSLARIMSLHTRMAVVHVYARASELSGSAQRTNDRTKRLVPGGQILQSVTVSAGLQQCSCGHCTIQCMRCFAHYHIFLEPVTATKCAQLL